MLSLSRSVAAQTILPRDVEIAQYMVDGHDRPEISKILGISVSTVGRHILKLKRLTGSQTHAQMIRELGRRGFLNGTETAGQKAADIVRGNMLAHPDGEVEEHVNQVLEGIARELEGGL